MNFLGLAIRTKNVFRTNQDENEYSTTTITVTIHYAGNNCVQGLPLPEYKYKKKIIVVPLLRKTYQCVRV